MDEVLVRAIGWVARGVGYALEFVDLRMAYDDVRRDARRSRKGRR
ncbi:hypothetical protein [Streptomyces tanashiensis]|nr:hypothetical protein [Streptomyces tanashiensis]GGY07452.1 hypothetical protein GCM10010299_08850 [Streptomyces tanashiensis]